VKPISTSPSKGSGTPLPFFSESMRVKVAVPVPARKLFTYLVPAQLREEIEPGKRVEVPFGSRILTGLVLEPSSEKVERQLKYVRRCLDLEPVLSPSLLKLGQWISRYYLSPPGETFKAMLPSGLLAASENRVASRLKGYSQPRTLRKERRIQVKRYGGSSTPPGR